MHFERVLATVIGTVFGFGLLSQVLLPTATAAPAGQQIVVGQPADGAPVVTQDDPWH